MKKFLAVAAVLAVLVIAGISAPSLRGPTVVAKFSVVNQTAAVPLTTVFTPTEDGDYSVVTYETYNSTDIDWTVETDLTWTDEVALRSQPASTRNHAIIAGGSLLPLHVAAGTPIQISTQYFCGLCTTPQPPYDVFVTVIKE